MTSEELKEKRLRLDRETKSMSREIYGGKKYSKAEIERHFFDLGTLNGYADCHDIIQALRAENAELRDFLKQIYFWLVDVPTPRWPPGCEKSVTALERYLEAGTVKSIKKTVESLAKAKEINAELRKQLEEARKGLERNLRRLRKPGEDDTEYFDRIAAWFLKETGIIAPGKDQPPAWNDGISEEERKRAYASWLAKFYIDTKRVLKTKPPQGETQARQGGKDEHKRKDKPGMR